MPQKTTIEPSGNDRSGAGVEATEKDKIERVRDLILGPQLRDLTQRFESISKELGNLQEELARVSNELQEQSKKVKLDLQQLEQQIATQAKEQEGRQLEKINVLDGRLTAQIDGLDQRMGKSIQAVIKDLRSLEEAARGELRQTISEIDQAKMDRFSLGELFSQLGQGLKSSTPGADLASLLDAIEQEIG